MSTSAADTNPSSLDLDSQYLYIIRHGDRWDYSHPEWLETAARRGDPPLSALGHRQAQETGLFLDPQLSQMDEITWLSSPFLRCLQTSEEAINRMEQTMDKLRKELMIKPEYAVFEMDGHEGKLHKDLPSMEERKHYFPRVDLDYESLFVPTIPEPRSSFLSRCDRFMDYFPRRFSFRPRTAVVVVTHAAACVGIARAAAQTQLSEINPAGPCSITRLTRRHEEEVWKLEPWSAEHALNGYMGHISVAGNTTRPWNHFGEQKEYTGPEIKEP